MCGEDHIFFKICRQYRLWAAIAKLHLFSFLFWCTHYFIVTTNMKFLKNILLVLESDSEFMPFMRDFLYLLNYI